MDEQDRLRFLENVSWFNMFFEDLRLLFEKTGKALANRYDLGKPDYYYWKPDERPMIPQFYMMGVGGSPFAVQMFAVIDPVLLEDQRLFRLEPSVVFVVHEDGAKALYPKDYGLRVMANDRISVGVAGEGAFTGTLRTNRPVAFSAFQLSFAEFAEGKDLATLLKDRVFPRLDAFRESREVAAQ